MQLLILWLYLNCQLQLRSNDCIIEYRMDSNSANFLNFTNNVNQPEESWSLPPGVTIFILVVGGALNVSLLLVFIKRRSLRNSFGVYLMNLLITDIVLVFVHGPFNLIDKYASTWDLGWEVCALYNHLGYTYQNLIIIAHFLIAANRIWAVIFPFSYRIHHSTKLAIWLCFAPWVFLYIVNILVVITTTVITPGSIDGTHKCNLDTKVMGIWGPLTEILFFDMPMLIVILAYPVVCYCSFFSHRIVRVVPKTDYKMSEPTVHRITVASVSGTVIEEVTVQQQASVDNQLCICGRPLNNGSATGFVTLTLMTASVILFLLPKEAYYTWILFSSYDPPGFKVIADVLQRLTTVFIPILVVLGNTELRQTMFAWIRYYGVRSSEMC